MLKNNILKKYFKVKIVNTVIILLISVLNSKEIFSEVSTGPYINSDTLVNKIGNGIDNSIINNREVLNDGIILTDIILLEDVNLGNGIYNDGNIVNLINNGRIEAKVTIISEGSLPYTSYNLKKLGNGIYNSSLNTIGNLTNKGVIIGSIVDGIKSNDKIYNRTMYSGNGIFSDINSVMGNIVNRGVIMGIGNKSENNYTNIGTDISNNSNGIYNLSSIGDLTNGGLISGDARSVNSGNGIYNSKNIGDIYNNGIIQGYTVGSLISRSGNGIFSEENSIIGRLENKGVISGYGLQHNGGNTSFNYYGDGFYGTSTNIINEGIVKGNKSAIYIKGSLTDQISNFGILAGENIINQSTSYSNFGVEITLDVNEDINQIKNATIISTHPKKTVINGTDIGTVSIPDSVTNIPIATGDSYLSSSNLSGNNDNLIINGAGMNRGALVIETDTTLKNSIINGYNTALYLVEDNKFVGENVIFNGGGLKNNKVVIKGNNGDNEILISGSSTVNGKIERSEERRVGKEC